MPQALPARAALTTLSYHRRAIRFAVWPGKVQVRSPGPAQNHGVVVLGMTSLRVGPAARTFPSATLGNYGEFIVGLTYT